jgi:ABC-type multidrug transport system fused ATPase/permease subunit
VSSLRRLFGFMGPYRAQAAVSLSLLFAMVAADPPIPRLTQRIIDQGILAGDLRVVITQRLYMSQFRAQE